MRQIHFNADEETKKMLEEASEYLKINVSAFIRQSSIKEARMILKNRESENGRTAI